MHQKTTEGTRKGALFTSKVSIFWIHQKEKENTKMRDYDEIGRLNSEFNEKAQEAYRCYASLYLDFADDNLRHFIYRDIDISPLKEKDIEVGDSDGAYQAYMEHAANIAKVALEDYYKGDKEKLYSDYPPIREYMESHRT